MNPYLNSLLLSPVFSNDVGEQYTVQSPIAYSRFSTFRFEPRQLVVASPRVDRGLVRGQDHA